MSTELRAISAIVMLGLVAAAAPTTRFYGLSSGNSSAFNASPDGRMISVLFDNFKIERTGDGPPPKHPSERHFTLAATPATAGCRVTIALRGASLAVGTPRAGTIALSVGGRTMTLRPQSDDWTLIVRAALARRERTDVAIALQLPAPEGKGTALLVLDSVDVSLGKCRGHG